MQVTRTYFRAQFWREYWPRCWVIFLGTLQGILSSIVVILHIAIVVNGMSELCTKFVTRYTLGFLCWFFFAISCIATCCVSCCNQLSFGCATYGLVENIITLIFSAVLIDYNRGHIENFNSEVPSKCPDDSQVSATALDVSLSLAKSQLAAGVFILLTALAYIVTYIYTMIRVILRSRAGDAFPGQVPYSTAPLYQPQPIRVKSYPRTPAAPTSRRISKPQFDSTEF